MNLYMFAEHDELEEIQSALFDALTSYIEPKTTMTVVNRLDSDVKTKRVIELGIELSVSKTIKLKDPLNTLFGFAKTNGCDFVVGVIEDDGRYQDICYFGAEEGRPDLYEIAHYIGLEK